MKTITIQGNQIDAMTLTMDSCDITVSITSGSTVVVAKWYESKAFTHDALCALQDAYHSQSPEPITIELP